MRIITGSTGAAHVTSNDDGCFNQALFGDESIVLKTGEMLDASILDNNTIKIKDGDILLQGRHARINPGMVENAIINTGTPNTYRNDLIVARYTLDTVSGTGHEDISIVVIQGEETQGIPEDPRYNRGDVRTGATIVDFPLYRVKIAGVTIQSLDKLFTTYGGLKHITNTKPLNLPVGKWSNAIPYTQTVEINEIQSIDSPIISMGVPSVVNSANYKAMNKAYGYIDRVVSGNGTLTFYCYNKKPSVDINIIVKGV